MSRISMPSVKEIEGNQAQVEDDLGLISDVENDMNEDIEVKKEMEDEVVVYTERSLRERKPKPPPSQPVYPWSDTARRRKANFSQEEKEFLVAEYKNYAHILKRNSDATLEKRAQVWAKITKRFNKAVSEKQGYRAVRRTVSEVRKKWRAMCTQARKNKLDMADNGNTDGYHGWVTSDKFFELDTEIMNLLGENGNDNEGCQSDDAWSAMEPESPAETKWSTVMNRAPTPPVRETATRISSNTLPVQAPKRSTYNAAPPPGGASTGGNVTPIIVHTQSLADPAFLNHQAREVPPESVDECDYIRKKRALELEHMQLENKLLRVQVAKASLELQAMKAAAKQSPLGD